MINNNSNTIIINIDNKDKSDNKDKGNKDYITLPIRLIIEILKNSYNKFNHYINIACYISWDFYLL